MNYPDCDPSLGKYLQTGENSDRLAVAFEQNSSSENLLVEPSKIPGDYIAILGADDPEMRAIEQLLVIVGIDYRYATSKGERCQPHNAYFADRSDHAAGLIKLTFECEELAINDRFNDTILFDHHRPMDKGYQTPGELGIRGSSIGQFISWANSVELITDEQYADNLDSVRLVGSLDHCLPAAVNGECLGVNPNTARLMHMHNLSQSYGVGMHELATDIDNATLGIFVNGHHNIGVYPVFDLSDDPISADADEPYPYEYSVARTAAIFAGLPVILGYEVPGVGTKIMLTGNPSPNLVSFFIDSYAPEKGLSQTFGVPNRRYAGAFDLH